MTNSFFSQFAASPVFLLLQNRQQFLPQLEHLLPAGKGFDIHDHQVALAVFSQVDGFAGGAAQLGDLIVVLPDGSAGLDIHIRPS